MSTKIKSANYYKKNCIIPKGFEKETITKTDFEKTSLYQSILKSDPHWIKEKTDSLIATNYFIYYKNSVENTLSKEIKEVLNRVKSKNTFEIKIDSDLKKFAEGINKISGLNEVLNFTISNNQMIISYENEDLGVSSEFNQDIENTKNIKFSIDTDEFNALLKNCGISDLISFDCCAGLICASVIKKGSVDFDWTVLMSINEESFEELVETKIKSKIELYVEKLNDLRKSKTNQNQIILRKSFELKVLENPVENLPKIEKTEKREIKTEESKTNTGGFYILVEYREVDGKKYNYFTSQKFDNRESAKNFLTKARSSEKAMAIAIKIASQKEAEQKISQAKKENNIINYKWELI